MSRCRKTFAIALLAVAPGALRSPAVLAAAPVPHVAACIATLDPGVWLAKTGGAWKQKERYGYLRVVVLRKGIEHATDWVQVQILEVDDKANLTRSRACVDLEAPGLKGYVKDVSFTKIDDTHVAVGLDVEMKAMNGVVLRDVFVIDAKAAAARRVVEAKSVEID